MTHLSPEALAGYLDQDLPDEEKGRVELHLASCSECREELVEVRGFQLQRRRRWFLALVPVAAAAAALVVLIVPHKPTVQSEIRGGSNTESPLEIVSPTPESAASAPGTFTWRSAGAGASYTFTLQAANGRVVWTSTTAETVAVLPDSVVLSSQQTWFWMVDALLADG